MFASKKKHFKLVINFLEKSLLDDDFETLCLCAPKKVSRESINIYPSKFLYIFSTIILILLLLSARSLHLSYIKANSIAWISHYTKYWYIELLRIVILFAGEIIILFGIFRQECRELCGLETTPKKYRQYRNIIICLIIALCMAVIMIIPDYHYGQAPGNLADWWNESDNSPREKLRLEKTFLDSDEGYLLYKRPYEYYLTYTLITYIVIYLPVISVTIYSAIKDFISLNFARIELDDKEKNIYNLKDRGLFSWENICIKIERNFQEFSTFFENKIERYLTIFVFLSIVVSFESLLGRYTLALAAIVWAIIAALFYFLGFSIMYYCSYQYYEQAFSATKKLLSTIDSNKATSFQEKYNVSNFITQLSINHSNFYRGINLLIGTFILAIIIEVLKKLPQS